LWQTTTAVLAAAFVIVGGWYYYHISHRIVWTMVHVSGKKSSGDAHLLELPDGHVILIDTGFDRFTRNNLIPYLEHRDISRLDKVIVTHAHRNHYGGIMSLVDALESVGELYFNVPPEIPCKKEHWSTGCDYAHVASMRQSIAEAGIPLHDLATDDVIYHNDKQNITLEVVQVHDGESEPIGQTHINDTSAVLRLTYGTTTALFAGDINRSVGHHLVEKHYFLKADILTAPHHGVDNAASNKFLDKVGPDTLLVSNSEYHWRSERGARMRRYAESHDIPAYVTGIHGNVVVTLTHDDFTIDTQLKPSRH